MNDSQIPVLLQICYDLQVLIKKFVPNIETNSFTIIPW